MKDKNSYYAIIDFEATCWENASHEMRDQMEIIEWGCVLLDYEGNQIREFQSFIKPIRNPSLSEFCKSLTSIQQGDVDNAPIFPEVIKEFNGFINNIDIDNVIFCSWGFYDYKQLKKDCGYHSIPFVFENSKHLNVKNICAEHFKLKRCGILKAMSKIGMTFSGTPHRGIDDARNIADIWKLILFMKREFGNEKSAH